jgi:[3-methyl-2-oxobutanoate dehydrogenase (acetyl-transferring)] kinase
MDQDDKIISYFLDDTLTSRLGMRILVEHHLELHDEKPNHIGVINTSMKLKDVIEKWCTAVRSMAELKYFRAPDFKLNGHINCAFPYIETPLDYILPELLKNAVR